jgi:hypothetical protein
MPYIIPKTVLFDNILFGEFKVVMPHIIHIIMYFPINILSYHNIIFSTQAARCFENDRSTHTVPEISADF